jgi:hypothetical protein
MMIGMGTPSSQSRIAGIWTSSNSIGEAPGISEAFTTIQGFGMAYGSVVMRGLAATAQARPPLRAYKKVRTA